jgi:MFS family permease
VNVALPSIQLDLGMSQSALQWVVIAYGLLLGGFLLLGGRLGDQLGRRRILLAGLTLFSGASLLAGLAQSQGLLIGARALQGFGAALVAPAALSILAVTFAEGRERNWALGIFGAVGGSAASVGVILSGLLTDGPGWRWVFLINVPIGVLLIALAARFLPAHQAAAGSGRFDALGAGVVTAGLLLVYGLNRGVDHGWSSPPTLACFVGLPDSHRPGVAGDVAHGVRRRRDRGGPARLGGRRPVAPGRGDGAARPWVLWVTRVPVGPGISRTCCRRLL